MNERIKDLRKELDLTQQEFSDKLGIKRSTVATFEVGKSTPSDAAISLICKTFNVNETWLRTGENEMFNPTPEESIDDLVRQHGLGELDRQILLEFIKLKPEEREAVKTYVRNLSHHILKVDTLLDKEYERCAALQQPEESIALSDECLVQRGAQLVREQLEKEKKRDASASYAQEPAVG